MWPAGPRLPLSTSTNDNDRDINPINQSYYALGAARLATKVANPFKGLIPAPSALAGDTITVQQLLLAYPEFTAVSLQRNTGGDSYYHSLQVGAAKRMGYGLTAQWPTPSPSSWRRCATSSPAIPSPRR